MPKNAQAVFLILQENKRGPVGCQGGVTTSRPMDKLRRKLSDLEAALMLHSPHLPFKIGHKNHKVCERINVNILQFALLILAVTRRNGRTVIRYF